jgi:hypothetical protein
MSFIKIVKKISACFLKFVLLTALLHIGVLIVSAIKNGNIKFLNYFQILGLTEFWPKITHGWVSDVVSVSIMSVILATFLVFGFVRIKKR